MRRFAVALALSLAVHGYADAQSASRSPQINITPPQTTTMVYPRITAITPNTVTVPIPAPAGTVVATAIVQNSDGTAFTGSLNPNMGDPLFTASDLNVVLARATTSADQNTPHSIMVEAIRPASVQPTVSVALAPSTGSIKCDIGPPVNSIPAEAQMAGFTHCAMNIDFSQPLYAQTSNWANCYWFNRQNSRLLWYYNSAGVKFYNPCTVYQMYDAQAGKNVENFHWDPIYGNMAATLSGGVAQANQVGFGTWNQALNNYSGANTWDVGNYYIETVNRMQASHHEATNQGGPNDVYMYSGDPYHEVDMPEHQTNRFTDREGAVSGVAGILANCAGAVTNPPAPFTQSAFCSTNWGPNPFVGVPGYSNIQYNKYGGLRTSDGKTDTRFCVFLNDIMQGPACGPAMANGAIDKTFTDRSAVFVSAGSNAGGAVNPIDFSVEYIRIFSCDAYKTSMCNNSALVTQTTQYGQIQSYYH
jgi:hypothetical protein